jgi:hypothetical protein
MPLLSKTIPRVGSLIAEHFENNYEGMFRLNPEKEFPNGHGGLQPIRARRRHGQFQGPTQLSFP